MLLQLGKQGPKGSDVAPAPSFPVLRPALAGVDEVFALGGGEV